jgi:hypothetical protein
MALAGPAAAEEPAAPPPAPPARDAADAADADVTLRLAWIERVMEREGVATRAWQWGWVSFYGTAAAVQGALLATAKTPQDRVNDAVSVGKEVVAAAFTLITPAAAGPSARTLRHLPAGSAALRLAKLRQAEALLRALAVEERERRGWFPLVGGALLNAGGGFVTWAAYRGSGSAFNGWFGVVSGLAVAQAQFHTQPTAGIRAWEAYQRAGDGSHLGEPPAVLRWSITPTAGGAAVTGTF